MTNQESSANEEAQQASAMSKEPSATPLTSKLPQTSADRLILAAESGNASDGSEKANTVLYLAYGSNLCAQTFRGMRKVRPLSEVNVTVPTLRLTFSLPGIAYREPCFANVDWRKVPEKLEIPDPTKPWRTESLDPEAEKSLGWEGGLVGVVYEVTQEDWRNIMRTEGGGASYKEIVVPCIPIPPKMSVPEKPTFPNLPQPFMARTLFAPYVPPGKLPDDPAKQSWWYRLVVGPYRPSPDYAQASARYLKLLSDGAREHDLPEEYQDWLNALQPYTVTSRWQTIGGVVLALAWAPPILSIFQVMKLLADKNGKAPKWLMTGSTIAFNLAWTSYDWIFKPLFGDGERTQAKDGRAASHIVSERRRRDSSAKDEEMAAMMADYE